MIKCRWDLLEGLLFLLLVPYPTSGAPTGVDGGDGGDSDDLFCDGVRFKCYTFHLSSTELNVQCVPKISCKQKF